MEDGESKGKSPIAKQNLAVNAPTAYLDACLFWDLYCANPNIGVENLIEKAYLLRCLPQYEATRIARFFAFTHFHADNHPNFNVFYWIWLQYHHW